MKTAECLVMLDALQRQISAEPPTSDDTTDPLIPVAEQVEAAIDQFCAADQWPTVSESTAREAALRVRAAKAVLYAMVAAERRGWMEWHATPRALLRWLLVDMQSERS